MRGAKKIEEALAGALADIGVEEFEISLEHPADLRNGDYSTNVALQYSKQLNKDPTKLAEEVVRSVGTIEGVEKIDIAGAGFINFYLSSETVAEAVTTAQMEDMWGCNTSLKGKKVMVEYTDPNPFKEFHIGHLMANAIGESISRLLQFSGAEVKRANYQGDVGRHVARAIWGLVRSGEATDDVKALGRAYAAGAAADVDGSSAKDEITAINKKLYDRGDAKLNELYDRGRKTSLEHFEELYKILGTKFDFYFFESETGPFGAELVKQHTADGIFEQSEGAVIYPGEKKNLHARVFLTSEGLPTYEAKELGLSSMKYEKFPYDVSIIVTGNEVNDYFRVLLAAMGDVFPDLASKTVHISHGMMRLPTGKMSSRTGDVVTGESLLRELVEAAKERAAESRAEDREKLAEQVAVAAIKYQILKQSSGKDIIFDRERALSLEGDSGPYLQYAHARTCAIMEKAGEQNVLAKIDANVESSELVRLLHRFPEVIEHAAELREPHVVTNYLLEIAGAFNAWYAREQILDGSTSSPHKVALTDAVRRTLKNGLWVLGIPTPEKM